MERNPDYQEFLNHVVGGKKDKIPHNLTTYATEQEIGWWKQFQFRRAMRNARAGAATMAEIYYLSRKGYFYPTTPKHLKNPRKKDNL